MIGLVVLKIKLICEQNNLNGGYLVNKASLKTRLYLVFPFLGGGGNK